VHDWHIDQLISSTYLILNTQDLIMEVLLFVHKTCDLKDGSIDIQL
jgi:hypothetical protein